MNFCKVIKCKLKWNGVIEEGGQDGFAETFIPSQKKIDKNVKNPSMFSSFFRQMEKVHSIFFLHLLRVHVSISDNRDTCTQNNIVRP